MQYTSLCMINYSRNIQHPINITCICIIMHTKMGTQMITRYSNTVTEEYDNIIILLCAIIYFY